MRKWINICEDNSLDTIARDIRLLAWEEFIANCNQNDSELNEYIEDYEDDTGDDVVVPQGRQHQRNIEFLDNNFLNWCKAKISEKCEELIISIATHSRHNAIRVFRAIDALPNWQPETETRPHIHWSVDPDQAIPHFAEQLPGHVLYCIEADIPFESVDWSATVRANLSEEFGDECEITALPHSPIHIISVTRK